MLGGWMDRRVLALPGNPVAAALLGMVLLSAWCHAALGRRGNPPYWERLQAVATTAVRGSPNKTCLWLARTEVDGVGRVMVEVLTPQDSTRFAPLLRADALVVMPAGAGVEAGATVDVIRMPNSVPLAHRSGRPFA